jgi:proteasome accessory factor B
MFRLSRVIGDVDLVGEEDAFTVPEGTDIRRLASRLAPDTTERTAVLRVRPGKALALRHRAAAEVSGEDGDDGWDRLELGFGRLESMVDELVGYGPDVVVEEPQELRDAVVERLRAVAGAA